MRLYFFIFVFLTCSLSTFAQQDSTRVGKKDIQLNSIKYNPLSPSKAAFYSAVFPGAGQIYNNRYWWQLPLIYGGMGLSIYSYLDNNNEYQRYRNAFKQRQAGLQDEFSGIISDAGLESAQKQLRQNRDLSLLSTVLIYVLQIVEASVTAHLLQFDTNDGVSIKPFVQPNNFVVESPNVGFTLKYSF